MKKGVVFFPIFFIVSLLVLTATAYIFHKEKTSTYSAEIGSTAREIILLYEEESKLSYFLEKSLKFAMESSLNKLAENGGYEEINNCKKINNYVIWNTCNEFSPRKNYEAQLKKELEKYLFNYPIKIKNLEISKDGKFLIIIAKVEFEGKIIYKPKIEIKSDYPNLSIYDKIYNEIATCYSKKPEDCIASNNFNVRLEGNYLKISKENIKFAVALNMKLQPVKPF